METLAVVKSYLIERINQHSSNCADVISKIRSATRLEEVKTICTTVGFVFEIRHQYLMKYNELCLFSYCDIVWKFMELAVDTGYVGMDLPNDIPTDIIDEVERRFKECKFNAHVERMGHTFAVLREKPYIHNDIKLSDIAIAIYSNMINKHRQKDFKPTMDIDPCYQQFFEEAGYHCRIIDQKLRITFD